MTPSFTFLKHVLKNIEYSALMTFSVFEKGWQNIPLSCETAGYSFSRGGEVFRYLGGRRGIPIMGRRSICLFWRAARYSLYLLPPLFCHPVLIWRKTAIFHLVVEKYFFTFDSDLFPTSLWGCCFLRLHPARPRPRPPPLRICHLTLHYSSHCERASATFQPKGPSRFNGLS